MDVSHRERDWVAYVGPVPFPTGSAGSLRMLGVATALRCAGRQVVVISSSSPAHDLECLSTQCGEISHVAVTDGTSFQASFVDALANTMWQAGSAAVRWLDAQPTRPSHVISYQGGLPLSGRLRLWAASHSIPLLQDVVEWYDPTHWSGGRMGPLALSADLAMRLAYPRSAGVIAISSYLADVFTAKGKPVAQIPPVFSTGSSPADTPHMRPDGPLRLIYFGSPGKKDLLTSVIRGLADIDPSSRKVCLRLVGPVRSSVEQALGMRLPSCVEVMGRVAHSEVESLVKAADFSILVRPHARFTQAGFPTKFVESLVYGTPVMANLTSDLGMYLRDGYNGLVIEAPTRHAVAETIQRALLFTPADLKQLRINARRTAVDCFEASSYSQPLEALLSQTDRVSVKS